MKKTREREISLRVRLRVYVALLQEAERLDVSLSHVVYKALEQYTMRLASSVTSVTVNKDTTI